MTAKVRLSYKIFVAFLLTSFMVVALMVGTLQYYVSRHFTDYVNETELDRLGALTARLASEYEAHGGWQHLKDNPGLWYDMIRSSLPQRSEEHPRSSLRPDEAAGLPVSATPDSPQRRLPGKEGSEASRTKSRHLDRLVRRLAVFDRQKQPVAGPVEGVAATYTLREITVDGRIVGWLGRHKREQPSDPLVVSFLKQQSMVFYYIGGGILLLAAVVAFLLSKHLLAPIRQLTEGTRALTAFDFDAKIHVRTKDELGQLALDFNKMADTLKKYEEMRRQWISDISHELRTPLAILRGEIEALQDGVRKPGEETFQSLHSEVVRLGKLVEDLHFLSLADSQSLLLRRDPVEPLEILKEMSKHFQPRLEQKGIELRLALTAAGPIILKGDADRLAQLFSNLLENTLRYTDSPGYLKIHERHTEDRLSIFFEDSAPGVPDEALGRLFDRLYRVDKSRSRGLGGSGLGLAICKQIVEAHGGTIQAFNAPAGGLLIQIELPVRLHSQSGWPQVTLSKGVKLQFR